MRTCSGGARRGSGSGEPADAGAVRRPPGAGRGAASPRSAVLGLDHLGDRVRARGRGAARAAAGARGRPRGDGRSSSPTPSRWRTCAPVPTTLSGSSTRVSMRRARCACRAEFQGRGGATRGRISGDSRGCAGRLVGVRPSLRCCSARWRSGAGAPLTTDVHGLGAVAGTAPCCTPTCDACRAPPARCRSRWARCSWPTRLPPCCPPWPCRPAPSSRRTRWRAGWCRACGLHTASR